MGGHNAQHDGHSDWQLVSHGQHAIADVELLDRDGATRDGDRRPFDDTAAGDAAAEGQNDNAGERAADDRLQSKVNRPLWPRVAGCASPSGRQAGDASIRSRIRH